MYDLNGKWFLEIHYNPHRSLFTFSDRVETINLEYSKKEDCLKDFKKF